MSRPLLLAIGLFICLIGIECMVVETAFITTSDFAETNFSEPRFSATDFAISPPDWASWGLLAGGSVVMLYAFTIPLRARR